jgi:hypothetical protein
MQHRSYYVRPEARAAQLLYAFVRGVPYRQLERRTNINDYERGRLLQSINGKAKRHDIDMEDFANWFV